jgi:WS/DGAT/MGAT family acyltransferase
MKQLTGLDASFLYLETPTSYGHVSGLAIYQRPDDPGYRPYDAFRAQLERRLHLLAPFRRRLAEVPFGLDHPYWINDSDFDLDFHVRHLAIPAPGDHHQLTTQVARIIDRPLDRARPLWEAYVMEGLEGGDFAILTKIHHATLDGAAGVELLGIVLDTKPEGDEIVPDDGQWAGEELPSDLELLGRTALTFLRQPARLARAQLRATQHLARITSNRGIEQLIRSTRQQLPPPVGSGRRGAELLQLPSIAAPATPFNRSISPHRRLAIRSVRLSDFKAIKNAVGATVNDVVMAVCAGGLRQYLLDHNCLPDEPLRAMVPVSIRHGGEEDPWTNRVSGLVASLPTNVADPLERVAITRDAMAKAKSRFELVPAGALVDLAQFSSPALAVQAARVARSVRFGDRAKLPVNLIISNVPGPRQPLYVAGAQLQHYYPVSAIGEGMGLNVTVHSYLDTLDFGLVSCRELVPDLERLVDLHIDEVQVLLDALQLERVV